jgi:hypothetical protein
MKFGCEKILMTSLVFDTINPLIPRITVGTCKMHTFWVLGFLKLQFDPQSYNNTGFNQMYGLCIPGTQMFLLQYLYSVLRGFLQ